MNEILKFCYELLPRFWPRRKLTEFWREIRIRFKILGFHRPTCDFHDLRAI